MRSAAIGALRAADRFAPIPVGVTVLIYHRVGGRTSSAVDLDSEVFRAQLEHLAAQHRVISLADAVDELSGKAEADNEERPAVVITFDDGTSDFVDHAVPALVEAGLPATLYACTEAIDEQVSFPWGTPPASWAGLKEAASTGLVSIESHTHTHTLLDRILASDIADELDRSVDLIGAHIGCAPRHFAYPKAVMGSPDADAAVRARFSSAALARSRVNRPEHTDLHRLWRTPIQRSDDLDRFAMKAAGGGRLEGEVRQAVSRWKYRGTTR